MEEYGDDEVEAMNKLYDFIGEPKPRVNPKSAGRQANVGIVNKPVLSETIVLLDSFFAYFNEELAEMLGDEKWKFIRPQI